MPNTMCAPGPTARVFILVTAVLWCAPPAAAFGADGCNQCITCDSVQKTGKDATAMGVQTTASGSYSTAMGSITWASGNFSTAMGTETTASGFSSTAMGFGTHASGDVSTAMGFGTNASGDVSTAMGFLTNASGNKSTAMGYGIEAKEDESLVNSGSIHGKNLGFVADRRLTADARPADTAALLSIVNRLQVFTHVPSSNYCTHRNWARADCDSARTTGLLAQQVVTVVPAAVSTPSSLTLTKPEPRKPQNDTSATARARHSSGATSAGDPRAATVLEHVQGVQSLDVHVLIAQLVGAVQAQSEQMAEQSKQIQEQSRHAMQQDKRIQEQSQRITQLDAQHGTVH